VAIPPPANAKFVRLSATAIETAAPEIVQELQAPRPSAPPQVAAEEEAPVSAPAGSPLPRLRVRAPSARFRALSAASGAPFQVAALTAPHFVELEPVVLTRRGRMTRIRAEILDSDTRTASGRLFEGARIESAALVNRD
jgi:hypothetical protein